MTNQHSYTDRQVLGRLFVYVRPFWPELTGLLVLSLLTTPIALLAPVPLKLVIDSVIGTHPAPSLLTALLPDVWLASPRALLGVAVGLVVLIAVLREGIGLASSILQTSMGEKLVVSFRSMLFHHVQRLSLRYHDVQGTHDSTYRILYDAPAVRWLTVQGFLPLASSLFMLVFTLYVMARIDWHLAVVALAIAPLLILVTTTWRKSLRRQWMEAKRRDSKAASVVQEALGAVRVVKAFGQEEREQRRYLGDAYEGARAHVLATRSEGLFSLTNGTIVALGTGLVLLIGALDIEAGRLTLGDLVLVMAYLAQLYAPLRMISGTIGTIQNSMASAERVLTLLDEPSDVSERADPVPLRRARGEIAFHHVSFRYDDRQEVLEDVDVRIPPGSRVGIAGPTGAGKTTLVSLLCRFYDPNAGRITLDGVDLRDYGLADLRNQFGIVLQEPVLFSSSIAENIAYARPHASRKEIAAAAKAANAHDFITALPEGYDTLVGERGMRLSGGERQRISLARAFLLDAPILILDEPTSSVDMTTEAGIIEAMERLMKGRTTLMIAHRVSTLESCDVLLVLDHGRVVESTRPSRSLQDQVRKAGV